jgi:hypothetical protein
MGQSSNACFDAVAGSAGAEPVGGTWRSLVAARIATRAAITAAVAG